MRLDLEGAQEKLNDSAQWEEQDTWHSLTSGDENWDVTRDQGSSSSHVSGSAYLRRSGIHDYHHCGSASLLSSAICFHFCSATSHPVPCLYSSRPQKNHLD